jgi:hypothetical protein
MKERSGNLAGSGRREVGEEVAAIKGTFISVVIEGTISIPCAF